MRILYNVSLSSSAPSPNSSQVTPYLYTQSSSYSNSISHHSVQASQSSLCWLITLSYWACSVVFSITGVISLNNTDCHSSNNNWMPISLHKVENIAKTLCQPPRLYMGIWARVCMGLVWVYMCICHVVLRRLWFLEVIHHLWLIQSFHFLFCMSLSLEGRV